jgi:hypothetical protein
LSTRSSTSAIAASTHSEARPARGVHSPTSRNTRASSAIAPGQDRPRGARHWTRRASPRRRRLSRRYRSTPVGAVWRRRMRRPRGHGWSSPSTSAVARCCSSIDAAAVTGVSLARDCDTARPRAAESGALHGKRRARGQRTCRCPGHGIPVYVAGCPERTGEALNPLTIR